MRNKKILMVTPSLTGGGSERVMAILAGELAQVHDVTLCLVREKKDSYKVNESVKVVRFRSAVKSAPLKMLSRALFLRKEMKKCDCVISFMYDINFLTLVSGIGLKKSIIVSERGNPAVENRRGLWVRLGRKLLYPMADHVVFQTEQAQSFFPGHIRKKSAIIPNPLDTASLPERFEGDRTGNIIAAGRLCEQKNFPMLLKGFAAFHADHPEYRLVIYGEGHLRSALENLAGELGIGSCVDMPGFTDNLQRKMADAAMYVSTSNYEGISNSMLEALGMGVPAIVTDCPVGGARMFVRTDDNGILIPMEDVEALTKAMNCIADNPEYAERISRNAVAIREELDAKAISRRWLELVEE